MWHACIQVLYNTYVSMGWLCLKEPARILIYCIFGAIWSCHCYSLFKLSTDLKGLIRWVSFVTLVFELQTEQKDAHTLACTINIRMSACMYTLWDQSIYHMAQFWTKLNHPVYITALYWMHPYIMYISQCTFNTASPGSARSRACTTDTYSAL